MQETRLALKLVKVKIKKNQNPAGKEGLKKKKKNEVRKHINILEYHQTGEIRKKKIPGT